MKGLIQKTKQHFEGMKDPRTQCPALRHSYAGMLAMVAVAMMFAANGPTAVVRFWNDNRRAQAEAAARIAAGARPGEASQP